MVTFWTGGDTFTHKDTLVLTDIFPCEPGLAGCPLILLLPLFLSYASFCDIPKCSMPLLTQLVPWGTDGRLPLSDLDLDLGSGHTAYRRASLIDLYLRTKFD